MMVVGHRTIPVRYVVLLLIIYLSTVLMKDIAQLPFSHQNNALNVWQVNETREDLHNLIEYIQQ